MTDPNYTHIAVVLDRSGSMQPIETDTIGGFNAFVESQRREPGRCSLTLVRFDTEFTVDYVDKPIADVPAMTVETFCPRGSTALRDAVCRTINEVGARLSSLREDQRPSKVVFVIITDGQENASREYSAAQVKSMIEHQKNLYNWQFAYLGANHDAVAAGMSMGISGGTSVNYSAHMVAAAFSNTSDNISSMRQDRGVDVQLCAYSAQQIDSQTLPT